MPNTQKCGLHGRVNCWSTVCQAHARRQTERAAEARPVKIVHRTDVN